MRRKSIFRLVCICICLGTISCSTPAFYKPGTLGKKTKSSTTLIPAGQTLGEEGFVKTGDKIKLHYFVQGTGKTPVLMLHGGPGYPFAGPWDGLEDLTQEFSFIYYAQRGCGKSSRPIERFESSNYWENMQQLEKNLGLDQHILDIERFRRIIGVDKLILIGHSFGGFLACLYAIEFPEHVGKLVLIAPADLIVFPQDSGGLYQLVSDKLPTDQKSAYNAWLERFFDYGSIFNKTENELVELNLEFVPFYAAALENMGRSLPNHATDDAGIGGWVQHAVFFSMGREHDYSKPFSKISAPVMIVYGTEDLSYNAQTHRIYLSIIPHAKTTVIKDAGHFPFYQRPSEFAAVMRQFPGE